MSPQEPFYELIAFLWKQQFSLDPYLPETY